MKSKRDIKRRNINKNKKRKFMKIHNNNPKEILKDLIKKPLIKQRTPEWFKLREDRLTASDLYDAVKSPLTLAKRKIKGNAFNSSGIPALKWGVMFEPIAIQIYAHLNKTKIHEFGLIINDDISNFGASPDGITDEGIMIEIKCPYSRKIISDKIPDKYQYQIQGQLAVCKLQECDYIECEFGSYTSENEYLDAIIDDNYKIKYLNLIDKKIPNINLWYFYGGKRNDYFIVKEEVFEYPFVVFYAVKNRLIYQELFVEILPYFIEALLVLVILASYLSTMRVGRGRY